MIGLLVEIVVGCGILTWGGMLTRTGTLRIASALRKDAALDVSLGVWFLALPALMVVLQAATGGSPEIAFGAIAGGVTFNIFFTLGLSALLLPLRAQAFVVKRDGSAFMLACVLLAVLSADGALTRGDAGVLLLGFVVYAVYCCKTAPHREAFPTPYAQKCGLWCASVYLLIGSALMLTGGNLLIDAGINTAFAFELLEGVPGATLVAAGASLPLLIACVRAARKGEGGAIIGSALGANLFILLAIPGFIFLVNPIPVFPHATAFTFPAMTGAAALAVILLLTGKKLTRPEGAVFLALYAAYTLYEYLS